ncbi:MAG: hypothetical protein PHP44_11130 [Kiritimatiellae bacterium]|nr:hypothetical protein [Kiritimatiellia bacterium]
MNEFMGYVGMILSLLVGLGVLADRVRPKTPCDLGKTWKEEQDKKNSEFDARLNRGTASMAAIREDVRNGLENLAKEMRQSIKELSAELRGEMRRIEDKSTEGDKGLQELSKSMVSAITEMQELSRNMAETRKG